MSSNPYAPPNAPVADPTDTEFEYAGFWIRLGASLIDGVLIIAITYPLLFAIYGPSYFGDEKDFIAGGADFVISWLAPAVASILFWLSKQATPGKMALSLRIVDAETGDTLTLGQSIGRYLGYFVSMLAICLGFLWVAFDSRKQGWHDKLAGSVVVRTKGSTTRPVIFEKA